MKGPKLPAADSLLAAMDRDGLGARETVARAFQALAAEFVKQGIDEGLVTDAIEAVARHWRLNRIREYEVGKDKAN